MTGNLSKNRRGAGGAVLTAVYLLSMLLLFVGERLVLESTALRLVLGALAGAGLLAALVGRLVRRARVPAAARGVEALLALFTAVGLLAVLLYLAQADFVMDRLRPVLGSAQAATRYTGALTVLYSTLWICATLPLLLVEISYGPMDLGRTVEPARVRRSAASGLILALTGCILFLLNYLGSEFDRKVDLSYFKTTRPSESSAKMVGNLTAPLEAVLFFPGANEVQEQVEGYFQELRRASAQLTVRVVDHVLEPALAKELSVSDNGTVVLRREKQNEKIQVGTDLERAKRTLKKLDSEFQRAFAKLLRARKIAYFTVGHEERDERTRDGVPGSSIRDLRNMLRQMNYELKDLGLGQGLGDEVPADATLVVVAGPRKALLEPEAAALTAYLRKGGRALIFLDPEAGLDHADLLRPLGLAFNPHLLANDRNYVRVTYTPADRHFLYSTRFSTHPSVSTLTRNASQLATVMLGVGSLKEVPPTGEGKPQVQFTIHSMPSTFNDDNANRAFDADTEKRMEYEVAAAVTLKLAGAQGKAPAAAKGQAEAPELRAVVVADSDLISDKVFRNAGNGYAVLDAIKWLGDEEETMGETTSEEDIRLVHTREKDQVWFYLTIFGVPALVLAGGLFYTRRRRRS